MDLKYIDDWSLWLDFRILVRTVWAVVAGRVVARPRFDDTPTDSESRGSAGRRHSLPPIRLWRPYRVCVAGDYSRLREVSRRGSGFSGDVWLAMCERYSDRSKLAALGTCDSRRRDGPASPPATGRGLHQHLGTGQDSRFRRRSRDHYVLLAQATGGRADAEFHIVESPALVEAGARLFEADRRVNFHDRLPSSLPPLDLLHISTALQYVDDYPALLTSLMAYRPRYVLMVDLAGRGYPDVCDRTGERARLGDSVVVLQRS